MCIINKSLECACGSRGQFLILLVDILIFLVLYKYKSCYLIIIVIIKMK